MTSADSPTNPTADTPTPPEMYYVKSTLGTQPWLQQSNVLLSAGVAWRNPGEGFTLEPPSETESLFVDSGGFQATAHFYGEYPYSPTDLFEYAERVGADYVAGMDFAAESAEALAQSYNDLEADDIPPAGERIEKSVEKQVEQAEVYESGDWGFEFVPVVQGLNVADYRWCARKLREMNLACEYMAIGTVCKRQSVDGILDVLTVCEEELPATDWHLFGATKEVWKDRRFWGRFRSADTHAWAMKSPDGSWTSDKSEKEEAWEHYADSIGSLKSKMESQSTLDGVGGGRAAFAAMANAGLLAVECACGTEVPAYGQDFSPRCRNCERRKLNRQIVNMEAVDTARRPTENTSGEVSGETPALSSFGGA